MEQGHVKKYICRLLMYLTTEMTFMYHIHVSAYEKFTIQNFYILKWKPCLLFIFQDFVLFMYSVFFELLQYVLIIRLSKCQKSIFTSLFAGNSNWRLWKFLCILIHITSVSIGKLRKKYLESHCVCWKLCSWRWTNSKWIKVHKWLIKTFIILSETQAVVLILCRIDIYPLNEWTCMCVYVLF